MRDFQFGCLLGARGGRGDRATAGNWRVKRVRKVDDLLNSPAHAADSRSASSEKGARN